MQKGCVLLERGASPAGRWWLLLGGCRELFLGGSFLTESEGDSHFLLL